MTSTGVSQFEGVPSDGIYFEFALLLHKFSIKAIVTMFLSSTIDEKLLKAYRTSLFQQVSGRDYVNIYLICGRFWEYWFLISMKEKNQLDC
jgi:hypothetical protein